MGGARGADPRAGVRRLGFRAARGACIALGTLLRVGKPVEHRTPKSIGDIIHSLLASLCDIKRQRCGGLEQSDQLPAITDLKGPALSSAHEDTCGHERFDESGDLSRVDRFTAL